MDRKKYITCAGYYGSGSSAITDLFSEYRNIHSMSNEEFRFIQDPDGIRDLEYHLVENFHRHNSGHALKRYKKLVDFNHGNFLNKRYYKYFGKRWKERSYAYIDELTKFKFNGWWQYDLYDRSKFFYFRKRIINKLLHLTLYRNEPERVYNSMKKEVTYCSHPTKEEFLSITKHYINDLFFPICDDCDYIVIDQLVPPNNIRDYLRYFDYLKVVVVDRDPRDIYILEKYFWKDGYIPSELDVFCKWYEFTREHRLYEDLDNEFIKFIYFEDLIYKYDKTVSEISEWIGLKEEDHINKYSFLKPNESIKNTKIWEKNPDWIREANYIKNRLSSYIYSY